MRLTHNNEEVFRCYSATKPPRCSMCGPSNICCSRCHSPRSAKKSSGQKALRPESSPCPFSLPTPGKPVSGTWRLGSEIRTSSSGFRVTSTGRTALSRTPYYSYSEAMLSLLVCLAFVAGTCGERGMDYVPYRSLSSLHVPARGACVDRLASMGLCDRLGWTTHGSRTDPTTEGVNPRLRQA